MKCCWIFKPQPQSKFAKMAKTIGWGVGIFGRRWVIGMVTLGGLGFAINVILNVNNMSQVTTPQFANIANYHQPCQHYFNMITHDVN
jgi:hypothetical protein